MCRRLCAASYLAHRLGISDRSDLYREAYEDLKKNVLGKLVHKDNYFVSSLEEYNTFAGFLVASVVEGINFGIISYDDVIAGNTLNVLKNLRITGGGYKRNDDGDWYDR